jgi:hypothetical protein
MVFKTYRMPIRVNAYWSHKMEKRNEKMDRQFLKSTMDVDKKTPAYKIICNHCRSFEKIAAPGNLLPINFVIKKFRQKGWIVSKRGNDDICPKCLLPAPVPPMIPATKLLELTPTKPRTISSFKELVTIMPPASPPVLVNKVEDKPKTPDTTGTNWKVVNPVKKSDEVEYTGPIEAMEGEIRYKNVVNSGWVNAKILMSFMKTNKLKSRKASSRRTFFKREDLVKLFGEPKLSVALKLPRTETAADLVVSASIQTSNKETVMNFDPKLPPEMTKEDRRIIFSEIDTHYLDETRGYASNFDDKRIADALKVPLAWVRTLREENFGPERGPKVDIGAEVALLKKTIEDAKNVLKDTENMIEKNKQIMMSIDNAQRVLMRQVENVNLAIAKVNVQLANVEGRK